MRSLREQARLYSGATAVVQLHSKPFVASWLLLPRWTGRNFGRWWQWEWLQGLQACVAGSCGPASVHGYNHLLTTFSRPSAPLGPPSCRGAAVVQVLPRPKPHHAAALVLAQQMVGVHCSKCALAGRCACLPEGACLPACLNCSHPTAALPSPLSRLASAQKKNAYAID